MSMVATGAYAVTPNDSANLAQPARGLWIGTTGNVAVALSNGGASVTFQNIPSGTLLPIQAYRVYATGTTATNILALL